MARIPLSSISSLCVVISTLIFLVLVMCVKWFAMAPLICGVFDGANRPIHGVRVCFQSLPELGTPQLLAHTDMDGYATSWFDGKHRLRQFMWGPSPEGCAIDGLLSLCIPITTPGTIWRQTTVQVHLEASHCHCVFLRLLDSSVHEVRHAAFVFKPRPLPLRNYRASWTEDEDQILLSKKGEGWSYRSIYRSGLIPGRSENALASRGKLLTKHIKDSLKSQASHYLHTVGF